MNRIKVDANVVQGKAEKVASGATLFQMKSLSPVDSESTLSANEAVKQSHKECQSIGRLFGEALMQESKNIVVLQIKRERILHFILGRIYVLKSFCALYLICYL